MNATAANRFTRLLSPTILLLLSVALTACGLIADQDRIKIAQIGDQAITRGEFSAFIQALPIDQRYHTKSKEARLKVLNQMLTEKLLLMEADKRGIQVTDEEIENGMKRRGVGSMSPETLEEYGSTGEAYEEHEEVIREQIRTDLRLKKLQMQVIAPTLRVSDEDVQQFYEKNRERYVMADLVRIRFVTCSTIEDAQKIIDRVNAGESFEDIFKDISTETKGTAGQEWPLNVYMPIGRMGPAELRDSLKEAQPGDLIGPVKREDGFDVVQLIDRRPPQMELIKRDLMLTKAPQIWNQFIAQLQEDYQVKVFPDKLPEEMPF